ncbi:hypothetical protein ABK040_007169 [Willaertia magna]
MPANPNAASSIQSKLAELQKSLQQKLKGTDNKIEKPTKTKTEPKTSLPIKSQTNSEIPSDIKKLPPKLPSTTLPNVLSKQQLTSTINNNNNQGNNKTISIIASSAPVVKYQKSKEELELEQQQYLQDYQIQQQSNQIQQNKALHQDQHLQQLQQQQLQNKKKNKKNFRTIKGTNEVWDDPTLNEWPENDYRIYVSGLGNEVTDALLTKFFSSYKSFVKARVVRCTRTNRSLGYGFVSFLDANDYVHALENLNGKHIGNRPCILQRSKWRDRSLK